MTKSDTTKRLFLLRHALAVPPMTGAQDIARNLSPKGLEDAAALGKIMVQKGYIPDYILCSTAVRTRQTLEKLMESLPKAPIEYVSDLYNCGTRCYVETIDSLKNNPANVLLIGHNPCIYEYAVAIATPERRLQTRNIIRLFVPHR
jgi:phosphohistidine phosphatase